MLHTTSIFPKRRNMSVFVLFLGIMLVGALAHAEVPSQIWLTFGEDASKEVIVSWRLPANLDSAVVEYGPTTAYGSQTEVFEKNFLNDTLGWIYHARLSNLQAGVRYHYRIGMGGDFTGDRTFRSAPDDPCKPFSFIAMGDNRAQTAGSSFGDDFLIAAADTGAAFMLNTGDLVKDGAQTDEWGDYLNEIEPVAHRVPIMPSIGNHDDGPGSGNDQNVTRLFVTPGNNPEGNRSYYSFEYNNAFFAVITNHESTAQAQADWLDTQLKATDALWKFVFIHEPFFTCPGFFGVLGHEADEKGVGHLYHPVFAANHVDAVFTGHNHMYELFKPYDGSDFVDDPALGTLHVTTGGASEASAALMMIWPAVTCEGRINQSDRVHFTRIVIDQDTLTFEYYDRGRLGYAPQPAAVHYTIQKDGGYSCNPVDPPDGDSDTDGDIEPDGDTDSDPDESTDGDTNETETEAPIDGDDSPEDGDAIDGDKVDSDTTPSVCTPGDIACYDNEVRECLEDGSGWRAVEVCDPLSCVDGKCVDTSVDGDIAPGPNEGSGSSGGCAQTQESAGIWALFFLVLALVARRERQAESSKA